MPSTRQVWGCRAWTSQAREAQSRRSCGSFSCVLWEDSCKECLTKKLQIGSCEEREVCPVGLAVGCSAGCCLGFYCRQHLLSSPITPAHCFDHILYWFCLLLDSRTDSSPLPPEGAADLLGRKPLESCAWTAMQRHQPQGFAFLCQRRARAPSISSLCQVYRNVFS
ncbi:hypothetical protein AV530_020063 [Patagioenas fasciata monilis]|uniref:Uncharacterized protein n=1 Tax=Patagioenas fasciata monilis TaxID=372326 RepID=A0A1V4JHW1_PATFA|nr:hypothetical protein AV530_020063 [Patagioenas fasciata monilis]